MSIKNFFLYSAITAINFIVNFAIYNYSFNQQATPYLTEEQRVESALLMLKTTVPAYIVAAIIISVIFYVASSQKNSANKNIKFAPFGRRDCR